MASELVNSATSEKLPEVDWAKYIEICELVAHDQRKVKDVIKAIKKRLSSKNPNTLLYAVLLLEMLMNNIGDPVLKQVIETGILSILVKIVKKKSDIPVRERIFLLLDATQTSVGGASGKFPQFYNAYYDLVSAGVKFPQRPLVTPSDHNHPASDPSQNSLTVGKIAATTEDKAMKKEEPQLDPGSSILEKATAALEVLREVLDAVNAQNPEAAKDEFTHDLVEQGMYQKDQVMQLVMSSRDENMVLRAIELNEQLGKVLERHEALMSHRPAPLASPVEPPDQIIPTSNSNNREGRGTWATKQTNHVGLTTSSPSHVDCVDTKEEDEAEQLSHRIRKGKAHMMSEDEDSVTNKPMRLSSPSFPSERLNRPLIRPITLDSPSHETKAPPLATSLPPPPAKYIEREKFFKEKKGDGTPLAGHMRDLSLHSRNSSFAGSFGSIE